MERKKKRIKNLQILEGSLVREPANQGAWIKLWKAYEAEHLTHPDDGVKGADPAGEMRKSAEFVDPPVVRQERPKVSEAERMVAFAKAGGGAHTWTPAEVHAAMQAKAIEVSPNVPANQALAKSWHDVDVQALYRMYHDAAPEVEPEPVAKVASLPSWCAIEKAAAMLRKIEPALNEPQSIAAILDKRPDLYDAYVQEQAASGG